MNPSDDAVPSAKAPAPQQPKSSPGWFERVKAGYVAGLNAAAIANSEAEKARVEEERRKKSESP